MRVPKISAWIGLLGAAALCSGTGNAGSTTINFNGHDPQNDGIYTIFTTEPNALFGLEPWRADGGATGATGDGYLSITDPVASQNATIVFSDLDNGLIVKAFTFECDLRIGGGQQGVQPADGFSISYVRAGDQLLVDADNGVNPVADFAGTDGETGLPEEGSKSGLAVGFDTWVSANISGWVDTIGLSVRVDGQLIAELPVPLKAGNIYIHGTGGTDPTMSNGGGASGGTNPDGSTYTVDPTPYFNLATNDVNYPYSLTTGAVNPAVDGTDSNIQDWMQNMSWAHFKVQLDTNSNVHIWWKGNEITPTAGIHTTYTASAGRLVFGGRCGGNYMAQHVDNISLTTIAADTVIVGNANATPTGFTVTTTDSGVAQFDGSPSSILTFTLNGQAITPTTISSKNTNGITTLTYDQPNSPFPQGSTNTVVLTIKDTRGIQSSQTSTFTPPAYITIDPTTAAKGVDTSKPGFSLKMYQVDWTDANAVSHGTDVNTGSAVAEAERILHGDLGPNTADLSLFTGVGQTFVETKDINFNAAGSGTIAAGNNGDFPDDGTIDGMAAEPNVPGLPGTAARESGNDDCAMSIQTYIQFPAAGAYEMIFNSDDGFRMTTAANPLEVLNSQIVCQDDAGKGSSQVTGWVYVPAAGIYPFRTLWFEGGGGCNLEWSSINPGQSVTLINSSTNGALKAYYVNNGAMPAAVSYIDPPRGSGRPPTADTPIKVDITQGSNPISNVKLMVNGTDVTSKAQVTPGTVTKIVYQPTTLLPMTNTVVVSFADGTSTYSGTNTFTCAPGAAVIPPSMALNASDVDTSKRGFTIKTWQIGVTNTLATPGPLDPGTSTIVAEEYAHQLWGWPNVANLTSFTGPGGTYVETAVINYNGGAVDSTTAPTMLNGGNTGSFNDDGSIGGGTMVAPDMPGIVFNLGLQDYGTDNYALEIRTVLDLQPGYYEMGVNSDDGFRLIVGDGSESMTLPVVCGEYDGGRGVDNWGFTRFAIQITKAGLYPFRLLFQEGGGGNSVEWFQLSNPAFSSSIAPGNVTSQWLPDNLGKTLINDTADNPNAIKAYQYPAGKTPTYVKSFSPARDSYVNAQGNTIALNSAASVGRAGPDATVSAVLVDGSTPVDTTTVSLMVNGAAVTPTVNKSTTTTTVSYKPAGGFAMGSTNSVALTFGDRTVNWSFIVNMPATPNFWIESADFDNNGQAQAAASTMPYAGGAYAGLGATAGVDYSGYHDGDNPYYRYPNTLGVPVSVANDRDRGAGEVICDYRLGWIGAGQWYNYTRTFPAGSYNVYAASCNGGTAGTAHGEYAELQQVTAGQGTANQTVQLLGTFDAPATGAWGNNALVPLKDGNGNLSVLTLSGQTTLRYNLPLQTTNVVGGVTNITPGGNGDFDYLLFTPAVASAPSFSGITVDASGNVTITWTGGGTLQITTSLTPPVTWTDVTGATSPYTVPAVQLPGTTVFARIKQ